MKGRRITSRLQMVNLLRQIGTFGNIESNVTKHKRLTKEKQSLILSILNSTASKREAKSYLSKYSLLKGEILDDPIVDPRNKYDKIIQDLIMRNSSNGSNFNIASSNGQTNLTNTLRVAVFKIRAPDSISSETLSGIGATLYNLLKLGVSPIIILDQPLENDFGQARRKFFESCQRVVKTMGRCSDGGFVKNVPLKLLNEAIETDGENLRLSLSESVLIPLSQGTIPIVSPICFDTRSCRHIMVSADNILKTLVSSLASINDRFFFNNNKEDLVTVEKVIFVDQNGGIPSLERFKSSHVYINLLQEYQDITEELQFLPIMKQKVHLENLALMRSALESLSNDATGIITTPEIATLRESTGRMTNPIIYNILTDRPVISSSLPVNLKKTPMLNTTIVRKGLPITVIAGSQSLDLIQLERKGAIDLKKLERLIDTSFRRKINMENYLERVNGNVAGLITIGDYDGAAIVTWETSRGIRVPYLDKFSVSPSVQGSVGVADVVFKSLLAAFSKELLWRSRQNNPVNKWYFDRSRGNFNVEGTAWRCFYAGKNPPSLERLDIYKEICAKIQPSWIE